MFQLLNIYVVKDDPFPSEKSYGINSSCNVVEFIIPWDSFTGQVALFDCKGICITFSADLSTITAQYQ